MLSDACRGPHAHSSDWWLCLESGAGSTVVFTADEKPAHLFQWVGRTVGLPHVCTLGLTRVALLFWPLVCFPLQSVDRWCLPRLVAPNQASGFPEIAKAESGEFTSQSFGQFVV